jgi:hypothetical protein
MKVTIHFSILVYFGLYFRLFKGIINYFTYALGYYNLNEPKVR